MSPTMTETTVVTLKIDDREISARSDQTVLEVAWENGLFVPALCHYEGLGDVGACRLCLVEIKGSPKLTPACVVKVTQDMEVVTQSERLAKYRRSIIELLFAERNHICSVCVSNGNCELQTLAQKLGVDHIRYPYLYPKVSVDASHSRFTLDHNRCILCARCVRACDEVEGAHVWDLFGRGVDTRLISDLGTPWGESETCTTCGKCVHICPTGALVEKGKSVAEMVHARPRFAAMARVRSSSGR
ncbi:MAG TPA: bidirectional hydrogenase complex protein HoxU [Anaerolineales bacterium]|nr:bidirectional hydrogenase complex protein HoxU [Anaerolineales bacterium]